ncbi:MAG: hypothetical protein ACXWIO_09135, partial [Croceibacterium sp.]
RIVLGEVPIATTGGTGSLAEARASLGDSGLLIGPGYHRNNAGEHVEAEDLWLLQCDPKQEGCPQRDSAK